MRVLVACERFAAVRDAFRSRGHDAWSCDLEPTTGDPQYHYQEDCLDVLGPKRWDLLIAFPPCTHLAVSGARYFAAKRADGRQQAAVDFFMALVDSRVLKIAIENPVGIMSTVWRKPDQVIQPWQFGHGEAKATCLWLKGLPELKPTNVLTKPSCGHWANQTPSGQNKLGPSADRAALRGKTYAGIAQAMSEQWG